MKERKDLLFDSVSNVINDGGTDTEMFQIILLDIAISLIDICEILKSREVHDD